MSESASTMMGAIPSTRTLSAKFSAGMLKWFCEQPVPTVASNTHNKSSLFMEPPCRRHAMPDFLIPPYSRCHPCFPDNLRGASQACAAVQEAYLIDKGCVLSYSDLHKTCLSRVVEGKALRNHSNRPMGRQVLIPAERQR